MHLLSRIASLAKTLPKAQQAVLSVIASDPKSSLKATVEDIAQKAGVSMPSVVRTCRAFGYATVREFMLALAQDMAVNASPLHRSVGNQDAPDMVVTKILASAIASIKALEAQIEGEALLQAAKIIAQSSRVDSYSAGASSTFIANDLQGRLFRLGLSGNAYFDAHSQLISAATLEEAGVAIAISHVGRMPSLIEAVRFARSQGATVIALTQPKTPLAEVANLVLAVCVPEDAVMRVGMEAYIAHLLIIEMLTVLVGQLLGDQATKRLQKFRHVLEEHGIDSASHMVMKMAWSASERAQDQKEQASQ